MTGSLNSVESRSAFWPCFWLTIALVTTKVFYIPLLGDMPETISEGLRFVLTLSASDVAYCLASGFVAQVIILVVGRRARTQLWLAYVVFCTLSVVVAIASLRLAQVLRMVPTYSLIYLAGDLKNMQSSISHTVPVKVLAGLMGAPLLYLVVVFQTARIRLVCKPMVARAALVGTVLVVGFWYGWARRQVSGDWGRQEDARALADNPHSTFVMSIVDAMLHGTIKLHEPYPDEFVDDFKIASARATPAHATKDLKRGPRNVIVVVAESTATYYLSLYGSPFATWPRMQREANNALVFNNFYSHLTNTANSLVALSLSIYPPMSWREFTVEQPDVPGTTVAQVLKGKGYRTAFVLGGNSDFANQSGFLKNRGYDRVEDMRNIAGKQTSSWGVDDKATIDHVLKFVDESREKPFFALAWTQATHHPYDPSADWERADYLRGDKGWGEMGWELERYLNAQHELDKALGNLLDGLRTRGLADDTLVIITGDHGQAFGRLHRTYYHSGRVYQEDVNVPLIVWNPQLFHNAPRSDVIGAHVDLSPTVLDLLGYDAPGSFQGRSMFAVDRPPRAYFYGAMDSYLLGVRENQWKYVFNATRGGDELYDLFADPTEQKNLARANEAECKRFRQRLSAWVDYQKGVVPALAR